MCYIYITLHLLILPNSAKAELGAGPVTLPHIKFRNHRNHNESTKPTFLATR